MCLGAFSFVSRLVNNNQKDEKALGFHFNNKYNDNKESRDLAIRSTFPSDGNLEKIMNEMLIELKKVTKAYRSHKNFITGSQSVVKAVDDLDLSVSSGENLGLVGESGCGKTTLARVILKLITIDKGKIFLKNRDITDLPPRAFRKYRNQIQMVFQDPYSSLDPRFTIRNTLLEALSLDQGKAKSFSEKEKKIKDALVSVQMDPRILDRYPHEFSGGERQRIAIARALVMRPQLLILDEAVSALDVIIQKELLDLLAHIQNKFDLTYLFISHNLKVVQRICHKIAVMYQGKIVELAPTKEIFQNPVHPYTKELLSAAIKYKSSQKKQAFVLSSDCELKEQSAGHFVLMERK